MGGVLYGASIGIRFQKEASPTCKFTDKKKTRKRTKFPEMVWGNEFFTAAAKIVHGIDLSLVR